MKRIRQGRNETREKEEESGEEDNNLQVIIRV